MAPEVPPVLAPLDLAPLPRSGPELPLRSRRGRVPAAVAVLAVALAGGGVAAAAGAGGPGSAAAPVAPTPVTPTPVTPPPVGPSPIDARTAAASSAGPGPAAGTTRPQPAASTASTASAATVDLPNDVADQGIALDAVTLRPGAGGSQGGAARITNRGAHDFDVTVAVTLTGADGSTLATLRGAANNLTGGSTATVNLHGTDPRVTRPVTVRFAVTAKHRR